MAAFESNARTSNFNLVSPESFANGFRDGAAVLCAQRAGKLHPRLFRARRHGLFDLHFEPCMILDSLKRCRQFENVLTRDVFSFDDCVHGVIG